MHALEPPLDRLNYFNGQRLEAGDLRLEQEFHIRVRRWLNKSLYLPGIASGLEVTVKTGDLHRVVVSPGLAIDHEGREIILLEPREVVAVGIPSTTVGVVYGNYLVIAYEETKTAPVEDGCAVRRNGNGVRSDLAWGAPSRIRSEPLVRFQDIWAGEATGQIALAQVELDAACAVWDIHTSIRKYVAASKPPVVRPLSLEGEKDIDENNPKVLYFHIEGGYPASATLYLRASLFSTLYYTEMGQHKHSVTVTVKSNTKDFSHSHKIAGGETDLAGGHDHGLRMNDEDVAVKGDTANNFTSRDVINSEPDHSHTFDELTTDSQLWEWTHSHDTDPTDTSPSGSSEHDAGSETKDYVQNLAISFDGAPVPVLEYLQGRDGPDLWPSLGDGTETHLLVEKGTGAINLVQLGIDLSPGQHSLTFSVPTGGGQIQYNLYVG